MSKDVIRDNACTEDSNVSESDYKRDFRNTSHDKKNMKMLFAVVMISLSEKPSVLISPYSKTIRINLSVFRANAGKYGPE